MQVLQVQAQIVHNGERDPEAIAIGSPEEIYFTLMHMGARPLSALMQRRALLEARCIQVEVFNQGEVPDFDNPDDLAELAPEYVVDLSSPEIFVDPEEFVTHGATCVAHKHVLVTPLVEIDPELDWDVDFDSLFADEDDE